MITFIKIFLLFAVAMIPVFALMAYLTDKLEDKPKSNKFRQWWSRHIIDLDNLYSE